MYNAYKECYKFTEEELKEQPLDQFTWIHSSCILWNKKLVYNKGFLKGQDKLSKGRFESICRIC